MRLLVTDAAAQPPRQATAWLIMSLARQQRRPSGHWGCIVTTFENALLEWYRNHSDGRVRELLARCTVGDIEYTGVGLFMTLTVPACPAGPTDVDVVSGPEIESPEIPHGAGSVLFVSDGIPETIEVFTYAAKFPVGGPSQYTFLVPTPP